MIDQRGASRQLDLRDVDGVANVGAGEVDVEMLGDGVGRNQELDFMGDDVEGATTADARRTSLVQEVHGNRDLDLGGVADADEVDVGQRIGDRVMLVVARQDAEDGAVELDRGDVRQEAAGVQTLERLLGVDGDLEGRLLVAVDDGGNLAFAAQGTGGPLSHPITLAGFELVGLSHGIGLHVFGKSR